MAHTDTTGRTTMAGLSLPSAGGQTPFWYAVHPGVQLYEPGQAERLLRSAPPATAGSDVFRAARVLLHDGHPHQVAAGCEELLRHAGASAWSTAFRALRSEALIHLGDFRTAEHEAITARDAAGRQSATLGPWCTALLAESLIEQGRREEAAAHLGGPAAGNDLCGLPALRARGRLLLALHRPDDALAAFTGAARTAQRHGTGLLPHLPWRSDIAQAFLQLGRPDRAHALLTEELSSLAPGPRERGVALRLLSATEEPEWRLPTLSRAATELRRSDDRVELARVLSDFAHTLDTLGELSTADVFRRRAAGLSAA
ncbi:tetratricopeptide repeat protein [Streptomyces sp. NPDC058794]|uniref:tetratricopeptide repeat protein n=1 Tax=Streptomyces sp. NPDC058794 TaxID=3346636 RepID=UPI003688886D